MHRFIKELFLWWVVLLPWWSWIVRGEEGSLRWFVSGGAVLAIYWWYRSVRGQLFAFATRDLWYVGWLLVLIIASIVGVHPVDSFIGGSFRHQGVLFFVTLFLLGKTIEELSEKEKIRLVALVTLGVVAQISFVIVSWRYGKLFPYPTELYGRALGTFGEPNATAGYIAIGSVFLLFLPGIIRRRLLSLFFAASIFFTLYLTKSRAGIGSFLVLVAGYLFIRVKSMRRAVWTVGIGIAAVALWMSLVVFAEAVRDRPVSLYESRDVIWNLGVAAAMKRPWLGYGAESGEAVYERMFQSRAITLGQFAVDRAHNVFLDVVLWSGLIGLVCFLGWLVSALGRLVRERQWTGVVGVLGWIVFALFQPVGLIHWVFLFLLLYG